MTAAGDRTRGDQRMTDETVEQIDFDARTIPAVVERAGAVFGDREGLVDGERRLTFAELAAAADEAGRAFIASGIERGDRVAIWAPNMGEWVIAALGALRAGAVVVTVNTRFKGAEAAHVIATARAPAAAHDHRLPRHRLRGPAGRGGRRPTAWRRPWSWPGPSPTGAVAVGRRPGPGRRRSTPPPAPSPGRRDRAPTTSARSSSRRARPGSPRGPCCAHGASVRAYHDWADVVGPEPRATAT